ncbi:MAG: Verru_Chthon cassette protein A [Verrucomicrobiota bacterium]
MQSRKSSPQRFQNKGVILITVIFLVAAMSLLVISVFSISSKESRASSTFAESMRVRQFADTAMRLVIGQIRQATTHPTDPDRPVSWVSQPGAIRTIPLPSDPGITHKIFKLYSSSEMIVQLQNESALPVLESEIAALADWQSNPTKAARFVDLNEPVSRIIDGDLTETYFPILDPRARSEDLVEGFDYSATSIEGTVREGSTSDRIPMPVEWIYVLRDGTLGELNANGVFAGPGSANASNPIVARLAFWTDDESCKINVNTASEAIPWDTPRCMNDVDLEYARKQPVHNEFQRFPGHPATTSLSSVLFPERRASGHSKDSNLNELSEDELRSIYALVPRVSAEDGGFLNNSRKRVTIDDDRLYATYDEMLFAIDRQQNTVFRSLDREKLERARGFLTANSKAPELNVFGRPRVSIWPIDGSREYSNLPPKRSAFDELIAFCTTIGDIEALSQITGSNAGRGSYYFFRGQDKREGSDWYPPVSSATYWGFYGPGREAGRDQGPGTHKLNHNYWLYRYLVDQTNSDIPGYGGSLREKYGKFVLGDGRESRNHSPFNAHFVPFLFYDQIISTNLYDTTLRGDGQRVYPFAGENRTEYGRGYLMPNQWIEEHRGGGNKPAESTFRDRRGPNQGFGRSFTLSEVGLSIICIAENVNGVISGNTAIASSFPTGAPPNKAQVEEREETFLAPGEKLVQMAIIPEVFIPAQGHAMTWCKSILRLKAADGGFIGRVPGESDDHLVSSASERVEPKDDKLVYDEESGAMLEMERYLSFSELFDRISYQGRFRGPNDPIEKEILFRNDNHAFTPFSVEEIPDDFVAWGGYGGIDFFTYKTDETGDKQMRAIYSQPFIVSGDSFRYPDDISSFTFELESVDPFGFKWNDVDPYEDYPKVLLASNRRSLQGFFLNFPIVIRGEGLPIPEIADGTFFVGPDADHAYTWPGRLYEVGEDEEPGASDILIQGDGLDGSTDVVRSMVVAHGDYRITAATIYPGRTSTNNTTASDRDDRKGDGPIQFVPHPGYFDSSRHSAHSLTKSNGRPLETTDRRAGFPAARSYSGNNLLNQVAPDYPISPNTPGGNYNFTSWPTRALKNQAAQAGYRYSTDPSKTRDWDNGSGLSPDGPFIGKPDDGAKRSVGSRPPYFAPSARDWGGEVNAEEESFSPNRLISSVAGFGSLPSLAPLAIPWTTLLFRPDISPQGHIGAAGEGLNRNVQHPPDHMWLDLFWMPVVQPYAISQPFATAGKVNMNYQIFPFTNIKRATALHAVLKSEEILAIPSGAGNSYKNWNARPSGWRHRIDPVETLEQWEQKFSDGELFLTESEICEQFLVPEDESLSSMKSFWNGHGLTGDNTLEKPYDRLYPRLCTKSNIFRVHIRAQTLKKSRSSPPDSFDPAKDSVSGEYRGSTVIERYVEPTDPLIPDYVDEIRRTTPRAGDPSRSDNFPSVDRFYRYRVLSVKRFSP